MSLRLLTVKVRTVGQLCGVDGAELVGFWPQLGRAQIENDFDSHLMLCPWFVTSGGTSG